MAAIAAGVYHTCALMMGGTAVECFGHNGKGQLGDGTTTDRHTPVAVTGLSGPVQALAVGQYHTCALMTGGTAVECFGANAYGQLGDGTTTNRNTPVAVSGLSGA